jgi:hypothetical protein
LVSHLPDRAGALVRWSTQLAPGGLLLLDELEEVSSDEPVFRRYLEIAQDVVERAGGRLFVGSELAALVDPPGTERASDDVVTFEISAADSARIFGMNLAVLVERGEVGSSPELTDALNEIASTGRAPTSTWRMRQLAFRRV